ncbi:unnamed protein product [Caenorhabditis nigoni]
MASWIQQNMGIAMNIFHNITTDGFDSNTMAGILDKHCDGNTKEQCLKSPDEFMKACEELKVSDCYDRISKGVLKHCVAKEDSPVCSWVTTTQATTTSSNLTAIAIGCIIGGIFLCVLAIGIYMFFCKKKTPDAQGINAMEANTGEKKKKNKGKATGVSETKGTAANTGVTTKKNVETTGTGYTAI